MFKFLYCLLIGMFQTFIFANQIEKLTTQKESKTEEDSPSIVKDFCEKYDNQKDFFNDMTKEILSNEKRRAELASGLARKKYPKCELAIKDYLKKTLSEKEYTPKQGEQAFITLGLIAKIPDASQVIEKEIDKGYLSSWIDILKETNDAGYIQSLKSWIKRVAKEIREKDNTKILDPSLYGKPSTDGKEIKYPDMVRIWTPILMNRFLNEMIARKTKLTENEFNELNIIYASTTTSYRETFVEQITKIVANNPKDWLLSYRKEEHWVQFRLFPIMQRLGKKDGNIKLEIIWISKYHSDGRIRTLALNTLEKIATKK